MRPRGLSRSSPSSTKVGQVAVQKPQCTHLRRMCSLRAVSVERGHDPRQFSLFAFGGAGPLHATEVARSLGMTEIVVPPAPGILCAQGLVASDLAEDFVRTDRVRVDEANRARIGRHLDGLATAASDWFAQEAVAPADRLVEITLDIRYVGQNFELPVRLAGADLPPLDRLRQLFFAIHEANYGYFNPDDPLEIVNFRLAARGRLKFVEPPASAEVASGPPVPFAERPVWFTAAAATPARLYARDDLLPGHAIEGPAVVEQLDATTLIFPGDRARVDRTRNLLIEVTA